MVIRRRNMMISQLNHLCHLWGRWWFQRVHWRRVGWWAIGVPFEDIFTIWWRIWRNMIISPWCILLPSWALFSHDSHIRNGLIYDRYLQFRILKLRYYNISTNYYNHYDITIMIFPLLPYYNISTYLNLKTVGWSWYIQLVTDRRKQPASTGRKTSKIGRFSSAGGMSFSKAKTTES